ncbi:3-phosphoinositide-dependent protein kinase 1-like [Paramacrobiotus metropolitanus]|uniref:3-phosphoinositide-dependent protein kinase 1-like n=1 Tax=Paramacrobiotus metropolitanus TaxID=2943436 RepID=UPI002445CB60|nr:3-phosphoinositide-dependent protein kinase 1-like [Paramacrobiotus metropolitanus]
MVQPTEAVFSGMTAQSLVPGDSSSTPSTTSVVVPHRVVPNGDHVSASLTSVAFNSPSSSASLLDSTASKPDLAKGSSLDQDIGMAASASGEDATDGTEAQGGPPRPPLVPKRTADDFIFEKVLGEGSFSTVYLARDIHTSKQYAIKVCEKVHIRREKKEAYIKREKEIMQLIGMHNSPFFVKLFCTFHDHYRLYFVMTYARNGEILPYLHKVGCFDAECTKFYTGEVVLALEHLHKLGVIHRDLKPENILMNEQMHVLITDFGSAKMIDQPDTRVDVPVVLDDDETPGMRPRRNSFVGTADYVSPELLTNKDTTISVDLWALGCLVYQLLAGLPPFRAANEYLIFQKILKLDYSFPDGFNDVAKDLVQKLLDEDSKRRLGCPEMGGYPTLKAHPFYEGLPWEKLHLMKPPPITPYLPASGDNEELRSDFVISPNVRPGFDEKQLSRLLDLQLRDSISKGSPMPTPSPAPTRGGILDIPPKEYAERLAAQAKSSIWHPFVDNHLILKQGIIDKRKGLFARRRMFLLTTGPHFYYVDPVGMVLKGEIPWSVDMRPEPKNFKTFFVHTPNRTYYLEDPQGYALEWCRVLEEVRAETFDKKDAAAASRK